MVPGFPNRFGNVGTIGQPFTKMLTGSPSHVIGAKEMVEFLKGKSSL